MELSSHAYVQLRSFSPVADTFFQLCGPGADLLVVVRLKNQTTSINLQKQRRLHHALFGQFRFWSTALREDIWFWFCSALNWSWEKNKGCNKPLKQTCWCCRASPADCSDGLLGYRSSELSALDWRPKNTIKTCFRCCRSHMHDIKASSKTHQFLADYIEQQELYRFIWI